ncbi:hypothetical protein TNCV_3949711 [Trichonephila clavipes]|nr:hypothetical protein TNCV_3949711 [Trichonephila clavipes]
MLFPACILRKTGKFGRYVNWLHVMTVIHVYLGLPPDNILTHSVRRRQSIEPVCMIDKNRNEKKITVRSPDVDKASAYPFKSTAAYLAKKESKTGIKCISFDEIFVKSSDASSMDFCAFGLLKRA